MKFIMIVGALLVSTTSFARVGNESGGGGPGIFCPASVTTEPRVQVLDIYEGRHADSPLVIPETPAAFDLQLQSAMQRLSFDRNLQQMFQTQLAYLQGLAKFLPAGVGINAPSDLGTAEAVLVPTGCNLAAIGYYEADGTLKISSDAFNAMSETQKAAFWAHETLYKIIRDNRNQYDTRPITSKSTRLLMAYLFSQDPDWQQLYYLSNECWRNHHSPYDQLGEWWYNNLYRLGIENYHQSTRKLKANDLIEFDLHITPYPGIPAVKGWPNGSVQCWELTSNSLSTRDLPVTEGASSNPNTDVSYFLTIPSDCKVLRFNGFRTNGRYDFSIRIGETRYYYPIFDHLQTVYDVLWASGIQRVDEGFTVQIPVN